MKRITLRVMETRPYEWLLKHVIPYVRFTTYYTSLRGVKYHEGYKQLQTGDIILTVDKRKLTSLLIPGDFAHAALCVAKRSGRGKSFYEIAEMTHTDYTRSFFFDLCKEADRVVILRCDDWDHQYVKEVVKMCRTFENATYDSQFSLGIKSLYCSELIYQADFERRLDVSLEDLAGLGRDYISPDGLYMANNATIIWDSELSQ